ncbi:MAG: AAA family ATPase, partial [Oscillospiraceae bacterium]
LQEEGALREGRVISVSGSGCWNITETFQKARGSVLFIDEAYGLLGNPDKITELIALMENHREDTVVILAGYEDSINYLLDSNPGFRSRLGFSFKFPDYSVEELLKIFELMCRRAKLVLPDAAQKTARDILSRGGRREDQGNARFVRKLFEDTIGAQQKRLARRISKKGELQKVDLQTVLPQDLGNKSLLLRGKSARQELFELIGLKEVKVLISEWLDFARVQKVRRDAGLKSSFIPLHMAFTGNPGSGKTEVARLVGRILKEENVLSVGDFFECGRQDLVGTTVGSTAPKVENLFRKARGSVIFIDEAYSLNDGCKGGFGDEAIAALIDQMEKLREEVVVIFAGYPNEINELLERNPGFKSRIRTHIAFPDYTVESLGEILELMAKKEGMQLKEGAREKVNAILQQASKQADFGNARFCRNLFEDALVAQSVRLATLMDDRSQKSSKHSKQKEAEGSAVASAALLEKEELMTLTPEDFKWKEPEEKKKFGF